MQSLIPPPPASGQTSVPPGKAAPPSAESIHRVLEEVLQSGPFCHTQQCQSLLRYIVSHSLAQEDHLLRERVIGAEVFGRRPDYETGEDPIVRVRVAEVRKRLAQFYQSVGETAHPPEVQIEIPSGSYRACFRRREGAQPFAEPVFHGVERNAVREAVEAPQHALAPAPALPEHVALLPATHAGRRTLLFRGSLLLALLAILGSALAYRATHGAPGRAVDAFWAPWTASAKAVIISVGSNAVYRLSDEFADRYAREHNMGAEGMEFFLPSEARNALKGSDLVPAYTSFVALGDVAAVSDVVARLAVQKQKFQERFPNDISFAELHNSPTVLVGGFNNPMTLELTRHLPFVLRARNEIDETVAPGRRWLLRTSEDSHYTEDYAIVTRLTQHNSDAPMMSVAGMGQYGTLAAANFICSPSSMAKLARRLPADWARHNLQVLLHVRVVDFEPTSTDVVAVHTW